MELTQFLGNTFGDQSKDPNGSQLSPVNRFIDTLLEATGQNIKIHFAGASYDVKDGLTVSPQFKFGAEGDNFVLTAGIDDVREGIHFGIVAEVKAVYTVEGNSLSSLLENARHKGVDLGQFTRPDPKMIIELCKIVREVLDVDVEFWPVAGQLSVSVASIGGTVGAAFGQWANKDGFEMHTRSLAFDLGQKRTFDIRVGKHKTKDKVRLILGVDAVGLDLILWTPVKPPCHPWITFHQEQYTSSCWRCLKYGKRTIRQYSYSPFGRRRPSYKSYSYCQQGSSYSCIKTKRVPTHRGFWHCDGSPTKLPGNSCSGPQESGWKQVEGCEGR